MNKISKKVVNVKVEQLREGTTIVKVQQLGGGVTFIRLEQLKEKVSGAKDE